MSTTPLLELRAVNKVYEIGGMFKKTVYLKALNSISFQLQPNRTLAIVGESGSGKSTLAKVLMQIEPLLDGEILLNGKPMRDIPRKEWWKQIQMIFQDPYSSLHPRRKVRDLVGEPLLLDGKLTKEQIDTEVKRMLDKVGLRPELADRYPHMLSGGQRQRIGIARAMTLQPKILICDEPVSALDVSIQAQVLNLLMDLQDSCDLSYIFISHDLGIVKHIADDVLVLYLGQIMELGPREEVFNRPRNPYTQALLSHHPSVDHLAPPEKVLEGELPSPLNPPPGCPFQTRCPKVAQVCKTTRPPLADRDGVLSACHF